MADITPGDLVILATMGHDTPAAVARLPSGVVVASFQNGLGPLEALAAHPTIAGMLYVPAERRGPGIVALPGDPRPGTIFLGRWPTGLVGPEHWLGDALSRAGFRVEVEPDIGPWMRAKALKALGGIFAALCDDPPRDLIYAAVEEARAVYVTAGLAVVSDELFDARIGPLRSLRVDGKPRVGGSTRHALARGDRLETASLHGHFVRLGARIGLPTPLNAALVSLAERAYHEAWRPGTMGATELREALCRTQP
jgi:2-dehydropantoate 2-reductase